MSRDKPNNLDFRDEWRRQVLADSRLAASQKLAAVVIADRADFSGRKFRLGHEHIKLSLGIGGNTVGRAVKNLTDIKALKSYTPGRIAGGYRYSSEFEINFTFLSDNSFCNGQGDRYTWQVEFINHGVINEDGVISLAALPSGLSNINLTTSPNELHPKPPKLTSPKAPSKGSIPSVSSDLQGTGYKEGKTNKLSAIAPNGAPPTLSPQEFKIGFNELASVWAGQNKYPKEAYDELVRQLKKGITDYQHVVDMAKLQADSIGELEPRKRPDLTQWLKKWMYDRKMETDGEASVEIAI
jgi:hypothetical protein